MGKIYLTLAQPIGSLHPRHPIPVKLRSHRLRHLRSHALTHSITASPLPPLQRGPHDGLDGLTAEPTVLLA